MHRERITLRRPSLFPRLLPASYRPCTGLSPIQDEPSMPAPEPAARPDPGVEIEPQAEPERPLVRGAPAELEPHFVIVSRQRPLASRHLPPPGRHVAQIDLVGHAAGKA